MEERGLMDMSKEEAQQAIDEFMQMHNINPRVPLTYERFAWERNAAQSRRRMRRTVAFMRRRQFGSQAQIDAYIRICFL